MMTKAQRVKRAVESMRRIRQRRRLADLLKQHIKKASKMLAEIEELDIHPKKCQCKDCMEAK